MPGRGRPGRVARTAGPARAGGGAGAGRAGARAGGGVGEGCPAALRPRGRLYKPAWEVALAASRSRHSVPSVSAYRPTSLVPGQTLTHELCAGKDSTPPPAPGDPQERG